MFYTVKKGDSLSGIARRHGTSIEQLQKINRIRNPDRIKEGQVIALKAKAVCKVDVQLLDHERNPMKNAKVRLEYSGKSKQLSSGNNGRLPSIITNTPQDVVKISIARMDGTWKQITEIASDWGNKLVTLVSPKVMIETKTMPHPKGANGKPKPDPGRANKTPVTPPKKPEATDAKGKSHGDYGDGKGPKSEHQNDENGMPITKMTNDQVGLDFLGGYTGAKITEDDYEDAAKQLGCEVAAIKAVAEVETKQRAFDEKNRPTILYERHQFAKHTNPENKYNKINPDISSSIAYTCERKTKGGSVIPNDERYGAYGENQYKRLAKAYSLEKEAALKSCSWGKFQIMGFNYKAAGFNSVLSYVQAMCISEREHLKAFVKLVNADQIEKNALINKDWRRFARKYNGSSYKKNKYDTKLQEAYKKYAN
nr:N-acetylmuramidase domain-containing protein [Pelotalea chapellei]